MKHNEDMETIDIFFSVSLSKKVIDYILNYCNNHLRITTIEW